MSINECLDQASCSYTFKFAQFWEDLVHLQEEIQGTSVGTHDDKHSNKIVGDEIIKC